MSGPSRTSYLMFSKAASVASLQSVLFRRRSSLRQPQCRGLFLNRLGDRSSWSSARPRYPYRSSRTLPLFLERVSCADESLAAATETRFVAGREVVMGKPSPLLSSFKLTYYTLLNLLRRAEGSGQDMEYVIKRSFQQHQFESSLPAVSLRSPQK